MPSSMRELPYVFQSTLSVRRATFHDVTVAHIPRFQSTLSVRRATDGGGVRFAAFGFQSTLSVRRATIYTLCPAHVDEFQSTLSVRRATIYTLCPAHVDEFQSTLSVRRATRRPMVGDALVDISIHALREESDQAVGRGYLSHRAISIHALREESDAFPSTSSTWTTRFQSTLSVRRATRTLSQNSICI